MENKKFRTRLFGFRKSDVCEYIQSMNNEFSARLQQKETDCQKLRKELADARKQNAEMQAEKDKVAGALIQAEEKAKEIVTATEREAADKRRSLEQDYKAEQEKLSAIRAEIAGVRKSALDAIRQFEEKMGELEGLALKGEKKLPQKPEIMPNAKSSAPETSSPAKIPAAPDSTAAPVQQQTNTPNDEQKPKINIIKLS